jgi:hypothetical protein
MGISSVRTDVSEELGGPVLPPYERGDKFLRNVGSSKSHTV